jgi:hypothetical protein
MKRKYDLAIIAIAFAMLVALPLKANNSMNAVKNTWENIFSKYNVNIYEALYSITEIRPYSIIQLEKTVSIYDNNWIAPETFAALLDEDEKEFLKHQLFQFILSMDNAKREALMKKIKYWCINDLQMELLNKAYEYQYSDIINSMYNLKLTRNILDDYNQRGSIDAAKLKEIELNKVYHKALNIISSIDQKDQLKYHADLFTDLAEKIK